ncbi:MAG: formylglycine-generating enzyme family protein [Myxococcota bacterium]|jgi:formylglycine-generating enzyme required for sulfatase activity
MKNTFSNTGVAGVLFAASILLAAGCGDGGGASDSGTDACIITDSGYDAGARDGGGTSDGGGCSPNCPIGEFAGIPAGKFFMGCSAGDTSCNADQTPRHEVTVPAFRMSRFEVTQGEYRKTIGSNPSNFSSCGDDCPVEKVGWNEAKAYCQAIGARLPTEAEWEYALRAGTTTKHYCGDSDFCLRNIAWYASNSGSMTRPVGHKQANAFGLYDMNGNVWEWVEDDYHDSFTGAPVDGSAWIDSPRASKRTMRGGSWWDPESAVSSSQRFGTPPVVGLYDIGFRCAKD